MTNLVVRDGNASVIEFTWNLYILYEVLYEVDAGISNSDQDSSD